MFIRRYRWPLLFLVVLLTVAGVGVDEYAYNGHYRSKIFFYHGSAHISAPSIAIVDMARIHEESGPFKALHHFLETRYSQTEQQIFATENELRQEHKELTEKEKMLETPDEGLTQRRQDFQQKVQDLERDVLEKKKQFNAQFQSIKSQLEEKLQDIIRDFAQQKGLHIVINRSLGPDLPLVLFAKDIYDLTPEIVEQLEMIADTFHIPQN